MAKLKSIFNSPIYKGVCIGIITAMAIGTFSGIVLLKIDSAVTKKSMNHIIKTFDEFKTATNNTLNHHDSKIDNIGNRVTRVETEIKHISGP